MIRASSTVVALACGAVLAVDATSPRTSRLRRQRHPLPGNHPGHPATDSRNAVRAARKHGLPRTYTTDMHDSVRTYQVPVTEQQWVPGYQRTWNIFAPPVLSYRLLPVTRWETRTETVRVPITKREYIPEKQVQQVPITNTRLAEEKIVRRVPIGTVGNGTAVARNESTAAPATSDANGGLDPPNLPPAVPGARSTAASNGPSPTTVQKKNAEQRFAPRFLLREHTSVSLRESVRRDFPPAAVSWRGAAFSTSPIPWSTSQKPRAIRSESRSCPRAWVRSGRARPASRANPDRCCNRRRRSACARAATIPAC